MKRKDGVRVETKPFEIAGKSVLVTGGARRIGRALALGFASEGANVAIHYHRSEWDAERTAAEVRDFGVQAWTVRADLADAKEAEALFDRATAECGPIDILANNASVFPKDRLMDMDMSTWEECQRVNATAPLALSRAFARQGRPGAIIHLLDARMNDRDEEHASYHASKRMLFTLMRMMALEFAPQVRVNAVAPGLILPPEGEGVEYLERIASTNPLETHGDARDVVDAALFLAKSPFVTGQVIFVDGGRHMKGCVYG
jgi:pteridine reductase